MRPSPRLRISMSDHNALFEATQMEESTMARKKGGKAGFENLVKNMEPLEKVSDLKDLKKVKINLKDFDITGEQEFIEISFTEEDLARIESGEIEFVAVSGRRC